MRIDFVTLWMLLWFLIAPDAVGNKAALVYKAFLVGVMQ